MNLRFLSISFMFLACSGGSINLKGKTAKDCPQIQLQSDELTFVDGLLGLPASQSIAFENACESGPDLDLDIRFVPSTTAFSIRDFDSLVPANEQGTLSIQYIPYDYSQTSTVIEIRSNDPNQPLVSVSLLGTVSSDQDGDGVDAIQAGGTDCDDSSAAVYPGAEEVYYDGVDTDCDGASDYDQDGDGYDRLPEGTDCDDSSVLVHPGISETQNLLDDDCDGLADEDWYYAHMVRITEVMVDPQAVFDSSGEWIEIWNTSAQAVNVFGWTLSDDSGEEVSLSQSVVIPADGVVVIGNNEEASSNGGVDIVYAYAASDFHLDNQSDEIRIRAGDLEMDTLRYNSAWTLVGGASLMLDEWLMNQGADPSLAQHWCASSVQRPSGDLGSPGAPNGYCQSIDHDGDGFTAEDGDCDDFDVDIAPDQIDWMNDVDDDCDGVLDYADIDSIYGAKLEGPSGRAYLGAPNALSVADISNDGSPEVIVGIPLDTTTGGGAYLLQGASVYGASGSISSHASTVFEGTSTSSYARYDAFGRAPEELADNTGDGVVDLLLVGSENYTTSGVHAALFSGGGLFTATMDTEDATMTWTGSKDAWGFHGEALSAYDVNGDGAAEVLLGYPYDGTSAYNGAVGLFEPSQLSAGEFDLDDADWLFSGVDTYQYLGSHLQGTDVNGDGYDDVLLCGRGFRWSATQSYADPSCFMVVGRAAMGTEDSIDDVAQVTFTEPLFNIAEFGATTAFGDIDNDGTMDLAVAAAGLQTVYVYLDVASLSGTVGTALADYTIEGWSTPDYFGQSLVFGDVNADGVDDLVVGAPDVGVQLSSATPDETGMIYVFEGGGFTSSTLTESDAGWTLEGDDIGDAFGYEVRLSDIDTDGDLDLMISAPRDNSAAGVLYFVDLDL